MISCNMKTYSDNKEFLEYLEYRKYTWKDVDRFMDFYKGLNLRERKKFNSETPVDARYGLMDSFVSRFFREFPEAEDDKKGILIEDMFYYISLDDFDYDYRETIIRVQGFLEKVKGSKHELNKIWSELSVEMPSKTVGQINRLITYI